MITIVFWATIFIFAIFILGILPGVKEIFRPLMEIITKGVVEFLKFAGGYLLWLIKTIIHAHIDFATHLSHKRAYFDPTEKIRK